MKQARTPYGFLTSQPLNFLLYYTSKHPALDCSEFMLVSAHANIDQLYEAARFDSPGQFRIVNRKRGTIRHLDPRVSVAYRAHHGKRCTCIEALEAISIKEA